MMEKVRRQKLAELAGFVSGTGQWSNKNIAPVLPMNRYRFGLGGASKVKAASSPNNRIVLHPERVERNRRLAELARWIKGE